jgi:hypothetical protein
MGSANRDPTLAPAGALAARPRLAVLGAASVLALQLLLVGCGDARKTGAPTTTSQLPHTSQLPPNGIRIEWKQRALRPAARSGQICIVTVKTGHFCASYRPGEVPATALRIKLLEHGFIPVTVNRSAG